MISFYPGPSRVHDELPEWVKDACKQGIVSINHRSEEFMRLSERTIELLKSKLNIPADYTVFYTTSATECWEIIAQSVVKNKSYHFFSGAFGKKWFEYTKKLRDSAVDAPFPAKEAIDVNGMSITEDDAVICLTQNETSNGTQVTNAVMHSIRKRFPSQLIAVDATSSMAGVDLDFSNADIWFASVQKCFGLPAGLGLMMCSPNAITRVKQLGERSHYNSLTFMTEMMEKWQTPFTPNVLNIYLLSRVMEKVKPIRDVHEKIEERYWHWIDFLHDQTKLKHLIQNESVRSLTVLPIAAKPELITAIKSRAKKNGLLLGEGYGDLKASTFRIANFPAIRKNEIKTLMHFLSDYT